MKKIILTLFILASVSEVFAAPVYMRSTVGAPWGQTNNEASMDGVFGAGNWQDLRYETANIGTLFSAGTDFIFMEGGDSNANELEAFIAANQAAMENWVSSGGRIFINSAPNEGDGMSFGFGVNLTYSDFSTSATGVNPAHPIFNGPFGATGTNFTGSYFSHASVSGAGLTDLILDDNADSVLSDMFWGNGYALFGGMTTLNFQNPNSFELRQNIIHYAANVELNAVPEPATLALMGLGLAGFGFSRKRKAA
jgi:hypothetical protein